MKKKSIHLTTISFLITMGSFLMFGLNIKSNPGAAWAWLFSGIVNGAHMVFYNKIGIYLNENK